MADPEKNALLPETDQAYVRGARLRATIAHMIRNDGYPEFLANQG
jgi:hypothetical protein